MTATATFPKAAATTRKIGLADAFMDWLLRVVENSPRACAARAFARLNALSDVELAAKGLNRSDLLTHCFGYGGQV